MIAPTVPGPRLEFNGRSPSRVFPYHGADGSVAYYVARYEKQDGGKDYIPWSMRGVAWEPKGPDQWVLFNLHRITEAPGSATFVIVEGEKSCVAADALFPGWIPTTSGGCTTAKRVSWSPVRGSDVVVFGQPDEPGEKYIAEVCERCHDVGAAVRVVNLAKVAKAHGKPLKHDWDVADLVAAGRDAKWMADVLALKGVLEEYHPVPVDPWPELRPLTDEASAVPSADLRVLLPPALVPLGDYLSAVADAIEVPVDMPLVMALTVASAAALKAVSFHGRSNHSEPPVIFAMSVSDPSTRKSSVVREIRAPLEAAADAHAKKWRAAIAAHRDSRDADEAKLTKIKASMITADGDRRQQLAADLLSLRESMAESQDIELPQLLAQDATAEALARLMVQNGEQVALIGAEGSVVDTPLGRYSQGVPNLDLYLSAWSGESYRVNRRNGPPVNLMAPQMAIGLCVQNDVLQEVTGNKAAVGRGLLARFLVVRPAYTGKRRYEHDIEIPPALAAYWADRVAGICALQRPGDLVQGAEGLYRRGGEPRAVTMSAQARGMYANLYDAIHGDESLADLGTWRGKLHGQILRIAGILQLLCDPNCTEIDGECMLAATHWLAYLVAHYRAAVIEPMRVDPLATAARKVLAWVAKGDRQDFSHRDAFRALQCTEFRRSDDLRPVFEFLTERGYLRPIKATVRAGRPSDRYEMRPAVA